MVEFVMNKVNPIKVTYHKFGVPAEVLTVEPLTLVKPGPRQVAIKLLAAPIDPVDSIIISGQSSTSQKLPGIPGVEGVGEIYEVGELIDKTLLHKHVLMPEGGTWQDSVIGNPDELVYVPNDISIEMAALALINPPTAWYLLHDFVSLQPGDWIVQNAANSSVGICIIQLAKHFGYKTINVVRDLAFWEKPLKEMGADYVVQQDSEWFQDPKYNAKAKLAINAVGGHTIPHLLASLMPRAVHVSFASLVSEPIIFPTMELMSKDLSLRGFLLFQKMKTSGFNDVLNSIFDFMRKGIIVLPIEKSYALRDIKQAVAHEEGFHRKGKILLTSTWSPGAE